MKKLNELLGTEFPIIQGGMANIATGEFAAACSNAGALGVIATGGMLEADLLRKQIRICKSLTDKPFGVNLMLMNPCADEMAQIIMEEGVQVVTTGAGSPGKYIPAWKEAGIKVLPVVAASILAKRLVNQGADAIIAEGMESGGHVGEMTTMALVPQVIDTVDVPVIAAGGIADGRQAAAAFALGACGIQVGTCLLASRECPIHENYKQALLKAKDSDTTVTGRSIGGPVRVLKNKMAREYLAPGKAWSHAGGAGTRHPRRSPPRGVRGRHGAGQRHGRSGGRYAPRDQAPAANFRGAVQQQPGRFEGHGGSMAVTIRGKTLPLPILQGGMGVGISLDGLAGAVAACGGMGTLSTAVCGFQEPDFAKRPFEANLRALDRQVRHAKELAHGAGLIAVNAMVATTQYADSVRTALRAGADAIVCGAGLPKDLPALASEVSDSDAAIAPIVSSGRAAGLLCKLWDRHYGRIPDFLILEGPEAGGHLGFSRQDLDAPPSLSDLLREVLTAIAPFRDKAGRDIPVFVAGGVKNGADMARYMKLGAAGAQFATRFIATAECDASEGYKQRLLAAKADDITLVKSPVGMPGRALRSPLIQRVEAGTQPPLERCVKCITTCDGKNAPYCISRALIAARNGDWENGLFFCGANAGEINTLSTVPEQMAQIMDEWRAAQ